MFTKICYQGHFLIDFKKIVLKILVGWLCFTSHRQRGHLETASPFTVPCKDVKLG